MRPSRLAAPVALTIALAAAGTASARYDSNPPGWRAEPAATATTAPATSAEDARWSYAAIAAGGAGLIAIGAGGALVARRRPRTHA